MLSRAVRISTHCWEFATFRVTDIPDAMILCGLLESWYLNIRLPTGLTGAVTYSLRSITKGTRWGVEKLATTLSTSGGPSNSTVTHRAYHTQDRTIIIPQSTSEVADFEFDYLCMFGHGCKTDDICSQRFAPFNRRYGPANSWTQHSATSSDKYEPSHHVWRTRSWRLR